MKKEPDLNAQEQAHVRAALQFLRGRFGTWKALSRALHVQERTLSYIGQGRPASPAVVFRVARFAKVSVDDVLSGKYPAPNTCPYCGHTPDAEPHRPRWLTCTG